MRRREFIVLLGAGAAAWPLAARAQQARTVARVGVLGPNLSNPYPSTLYQAILAKLRESGFSEGQNLAADTSIPSDGAMDSDVAWLRRRTIGSGVPFGKKKAFQPSMATSVKPCSRAVARFGILL